MTVNPLSYPTSKRSFSLETFRDPPREYRGAPFWGWVTKQEKESTLEQINMFEEMGMGGFHMHTRVGLDIPYMGEEFMEIVEGCVEKAREKGMSAFLYDEDRWPSGFAGGKVLEGHPEHRHLHLLFTPWAYGEELGYTKPTFPIANAAPMRSELGDLLATYAIKLAPSGRLLSSRRISAKSEAQPDEHVWYAYVEPLPDSGFFGDQTYTDLLSADMTKRFIELTHEVYKKHVGKDFGGVVPSMFTDEPQYCPMSTLNVADKPQDVFLPWTAKILDSFKKAKGGDLVELLPKLIWDPEGEEANLAKYQFLDHVCELFSTNYVGELAKWCGKNNIYCTGHMNGEPTLASQTAQNGEVMRCYREMHLPGIDMLCDKRELNTAKQASSVSRQYGRSGLMSELYGVTGWEFTFEGHKGQGDWQAALGVTFRVHHLFWSTMEGEAKRDYPGCIGYQAPWWKEYKQIEDHFARVNSALTRGKPVTRVAVIHPVESYWLCFGPKDRNSEELDYRENAFIELTKWLLGGHVDFDFISESLFPELTDESAIGKTLPVGACNYEAVIVPNLRTIRSTTLSRLQKFASNGGKVIIAGIAPSLVDAQVPATPPEIVGSEAISWSKAQILLAVQPFRDLDMIVSDTTLYRTQGKRADSLYYQLREDGEDRYVFICNTDRKEPCPVIVNIRGSWAVQALDTFTGKSWDVAAEQASGQTTFKYWFDGCESVVLRLSPGTAPKDAKNQTVMRKHYKQVGDVNLQSVSLEEPNVLLLDYCDWQWNDEPWQGPTEVLAVDQTMRRRLGFFLKGAKFRQPYTIPQSDRKGVGKLKLRFTIKSKIDVENASLAIESPDKVKALLDGQPLDLKSSGWWVDKAIKTVPLPSITKGQHTLELEYDYGMLTALERVYVLGGFGVDVRGRTATIVPLDLGDIEFGDVTRQSLPFYSGNLTYHTTLHSDGKTPLALRVAHFAGPAVSIDLNAKRVGLLVHEPYATELGVLPAGEHRVDFTVYGNRHNSFGAIHLVANKTNWLNADSWRSDFDWWSEEYVLGQVGILNAPRVEVPGTEVPTIVRRGLTLHV
ncbi:glycoside hydrolase family 2 [Kwoniella heveanensis BCC8398]|uniref:Glycoside hydrolase family 2 n=1 Tax=Kwoniella heveanensis BCC8398 TaxID=1296120 RepID=A0A1B9GLT6_9TREE|nr:glycoside hydrolase family 2 [Kwoniella heveanensis BCC8398]